MPEKQQPMSSFAKQLGGQVAQANAEHKDKPVDTGDRKLPSGIKNGVAKLSAMYTKEYPDDKMGLKGKIFFRASAIVMTPLEHEGQKVAGQVTQIVIPLCDVPTKEGSKRKAKSFSDNWFEFQNVFKILGVAPCPETPATDPTGVRTEAFFFAAMKMLTDKSKPVYLEFSTRGWTPPPTPTDPKPKEMVFEDWHGLAKEPGKHDPAAAVAASGPAAVQPDRDSMPPTAAPATAPAGAPPSQPPPAAVAAPAPDTDPADVVASLVETAMADLGEESRLATVRLEEMAWANGWSKEQTGKADDWSQVGDMALDGLQAATAAPVEALPPPPEACPTVGSKWLFAKRAKGGERLANASGQPFPPQQVEVVTVDEAAKTCTLRITKDGKDVVDIRTKKPVAVKFEWLERDLPY